MATNVKLGCLLPTRGLLLADRKPTDAETVLRLATWAEEAGMDSVWVGDSLTAKPRLEAMTTLAAIAARTSRVRLGTAVMLMALRHPVLLAQMMGTVDLISGGRLQLGVGVGGAFNGMQQAEWRNADVPQRTRARRLEEMLEVVKGLGTGKPFSYDGRHFQLDDVIMEPTPVQPDGVPVYVGVHWHGRGDGQGAQRERQARRAARLADGAISISATPEEACRSSGHRARLLRRIRPRPRRNVHRDVSHRQPRRRRGQGRSGRPRTGCWVTTGQISGVTAGDLSVTRSACVSASTPMRKPARTR